MTDSQNTGEKVHYICQTYIETKGRQTSLKVDRLFEYTNAAQAERRAEREGNSDSCVGADAYSVTEDTNSGEVGPPVFLARFGKVPEMDDL